MASVHILDVPLCLFLLVLCFLTFTDLSPVYTVLLLVGGIYSISVGINNVLVYKLPYHIMDMKYYGRYISISSALIGIVAVAFSIVSHLAQSAFGFAPAMKGIYILTIVVWAVFLFLTFSMKEEKVKLPEKTKEKINLFKY